MHANSVSKILDVDINMKNILIIVCFIFIGFVSSMQNDPLNKRQIKRPDNNEFAEENEACRGVGTPLENNDEENGSLRDVRTPSIVTQCSDETSISSIVVPSGINLTVSEVEHDNRMPMDSSFQDHDHYSVLPSGSRIASMISSNSTFDSNSEINRLAQGRIRLNQHATTEETERNKERENKTEKSDANLVPSSNSNSVRRAHVVFEEIERRRRTFVERQWPHSGDRSALNMAKEGFIYIGEYDMVKCIYCKCVLYQWESVDVPWVEHIRWSPNCQFARQRARTHKITRSANNTERNVQHPNVPNYGGSITTRNADTITMTNTCTIDCFLTIVFLQLLGSKSLRRIFKTSRFKVLRDLYQIYKCFKKGRFPEGKFIWVSTLQRMTRNSEINLFSAEGHVIQTNASLSESQTIRVITYCTETECQTMVYNMPNIVLSTVISDGEVDAIRRSRRSLLQQLVSRWAYGRTECLHTNDKGRCKGERIHRREFVNGNPPLLSINLAGLSSLRFNMADIPSYLHLHGQRYRLGGVTFNRNEHFTALADWDNKMFWYDNADGLSASTSYYNDSYLSYAYYFIDSPMDHA